MPKSLPELCMISSILHWECCTLSSVPLVSHTPRYPNPRLPPPPLKPPENPPPLQPPPLPLLRGTLENVPAALVSIAARPVLMLWNDPARPSLILCMDGALKSPPADGAPPEYPPR